MKNNSFSIHYKHLCWAFVLVLIASSCTTTRPVIKHPLAFEEPKTTEGIVVHPSLKPSISEFGIEGFLEDKHPIKVMSYNVRLENAFDGVNHWRNRIEDVARVIERAEIIGLQEPYYGQVKDLQNSLPNLRWYGSGRNNGMNKGEFSPIFYCSNRFELLDSGTFWLSETPDVIASKGWDAAITRICSWVKLDDLKNNRQLFVFNTHLDHQGIESRKESATLILRAIRVIAGKEPVILTGDLNDVENSPTYNLLVGRFPIDGMRSHLRDTKYLVGQAYLGPPGTFTTNKWTEPSDYGPIDFIMVSPHFRTLNYQVIDQRRESGHFPSDHLPVFTEIMY